MVGIVIPSGHIIDAKILFVLITKITILKKGGGEYHDVSKLSRGSNTSHGITSVAVGSYF